jgi:hypothetical protein
MFEPKLEILPPAQRSLWAELDAIPAEFMLCGGTAIALQLGHRQSVDFDFFGCRAFDPVQLYSIVPLLNGSTVLQQAASTLTCRVERAEAKDYVDLHALLLAGIGLPMALAAAKVIYGERFNPQLTLKALSFFGDGDLPSLPVGVQQRIIAAARNADLDRLPVLPVYAEPANP